MKRNKKIQMYLLIFLKRKHRKDNPGNEIGYLQRVGMAGGDGRTRTEWKE